MTEQGDGAPKKPHLGPEGRRFPRVSTYKHARIESEGDLAVSISGVVFEVGAQGCGVRSEGELEPGSIVKISLYDQTRLDPVIFRAKIVWRGAIEGTHMKSYGIQFLTVESGRESAAHDEVKTILGGVGSKVQIED